MVLSLHGSQICLKKIFKINVIVSGGSIFFLNSVRGAICFCNYFIISFLPSVKLHKMRPSGGGSLMRLKFISTHSVLNCSPPRTIFSDISHCFPSPFLDIHYTSGLV